MRVIDETAELLRKEMLSLPPYAKAIYADLLADRAEQAAEIERLSRELTAAGLTEQVLANRNAEIAALRASAELRLNAFVIATAERADQDAKTHSVYEKLNSDVNQILAR